MIYRIIWPLNFVIILFASYLYVDHVALTKQNRAAIENAVYQAIKGN
jgi:hypothetical protein